MTGRTTTMRWTKVPSGPSLRAEAFTLVELLVVLFIIGLMATVVLPSIVGLFTAGSDAQAYNLLVGQLAAARMVAIQNRTYAGVHIQLADANGGTYLKNLTNTCFSAIIWHDPNDSANPNRFILAEGYAPQKMPASMAFGGVAGGNYRPDPNQLNLFTTLTFVFASNGQLEDGKTITFDNTTAGFANSTTSRAYLWNSSDADNSACNSSVKAAVLFDYDKFLKATDKPTYLTNYGQLLAINLYTGTVLGR